jgi:hypothetical protein
MKEEQYNQNKMLNYLKNVYNEDDEESDNNEDDLNDINSISIKKGK